VAPPEVRALSPSLFLSLREGVSLVPGNQQELVLHGAEAQFVFRQLPGGVRAALERLRTTGDSEDCLAEIVLRTDGVEALATWCYYLQRLTKWGLVLFSARLDRRRLATLAPISPGLVFPFRAIVPNRRYVISRFAYTRWAGDEAIIESPLAHARITLHDWRAAAFVYALSQPLRAGDVGESIPGLPAEAANQLLALLANGDMLGELDDNGTTAGDKNPALQFWEFHDLLFHSRTRQGRHDYPAGGTYRLVGRLDQPPAVKTASASEVLDLYCPDLDRLRHDDPPFAYVQEMRRSVRSYADRPITARQLGEFLYRVARVKDLGAFDEVTPRGLVRVELAQRPYPSGGALYELELYAAVNACEGLAPGLYHYDPLHHRLERLSGRTQGVEQLLRDASCGTVSAGERLQVLLILTARLPRIAWKYASIAYALTLKHVGVLYQTMYLVATAMNLAPCAVGNGNADLFARAAGTDYYSETSVGEFLLGSKRPVPGEQEAQAIQ
jgi:oxazoline/thiazoline dehydrogenase